MITKENPKMCPACGGTDVSMTGKVFEKDFNGEEYVKSASWFCYQCGNIIGTKISRYENDIDPKSII